MELLTFLSERADYPLDIDFEHEGFEIRVVSIPKAGFTFFYFDSRLERISRYNEVVQSEVDLQVSLDSKDSKLVKFLEVVHENEPVKVWVKTELNEFIMPERQEATRFKSGFRFLTVTEWTKRPSYTETSVNKAKTELNLKIGFNELIIKIKERYEANNKLLTKLKNI